MEYIPIGLNEIVFLPETVPGTSVLVSSDLYNLESNNATEVRSQSVSTDNGNEHTIMKTAPESLIGTKIAAGELGVFAVGDEEKTQVALIRVVFFQ